MSLVTQTRVRCGLTGQTAQQTEQTRLDFKHTCANVGASQVTIETVCTGKLFQEEVFGGIMNVNSLRIFYVKYVFNELVYCTITSTCGMGYVAVSEYPTLYVCSTEYAM